MMPIVANFFKGFSDYIGVITLAVGLFAIYLYAKGKRDTRREAALLILQEVRYAEQRVRNFRSYGSYSFSEKLLPTNSWHKNINLFVRDLKETEIDLISKFFSSAAYLDEVMQVASDNYNKSVLNPQTPSVTDDLHTKIATADLSKSSQELLETISGMIEYIYNTPAIDKIRDIATEKFLWIY